MRQRSAFHKDTITGRVRYSSDSHVRSLEAVAPVRLLSRSGVSHTAGAACPSGLWRSESTAPGRILYPGPR